MNRLFKITLWASVSLASLTTAASADPISATIIGALGLATGGFAAAAVSVAVNFAVGTALSFGASSLLGGKARQKSVPVGGVQSEISIGVNTPRSIAFGLVHIIGGQPVYHKGVGSSNNTIYQVFRISDWTCESLDGVWVNGTKRTLTSVTVVGSENARYEVGGYGSNLILKFFRGAFPQTADSELIAAALDTTGQSLGTWDATSRGDGICYIIAKMTYDETKFKDGFPQFAFDIKGARLYDPRKDTTMGGIGTHSYADPTTWEYSANPALCLYNYYRGAFRRNGILLVGMEFLPSDILINHFLAAMNICDETVTAGAGTRKRYEVSAICKSEAEHSANIEPFRVAMGGDLVKSSGAFGVLAAAAYTPVMTITDGDLVGGFSYDPDPDGNYNAVSCKFTDPTIQWQYNDLDLLTSTTYQTQDGGIRKVADLDLPGVTSVYQAQSLQKIAHEQSRMTLNSDGIYKPKFNQLEIGDWVTRVFDRKGLGTFTMKVVGIQKKDDMTVGLSLKQCASGNFTAPSVAPILSTPINVVPHTLTASLSGFGLTSGTVDGGSQTRPTLVLVWTAPNDPGVAAVQIEYRLLNNAASLSTARQPRPNAAQFVIASDIMAALTYEARIRPEYAAGGVGSWSAWLQVLTTSFYAVTSSQIAIDTQAMVGEGWAYASRAEFFNALEIAERYLADDAVATRSSKEVLRVADATNTVSAAVVDERVARISNDAAIASIALGAQVTAEGSTAGALFRMQAEASPVGALARISAQVRVSTTGSASATQYQTAGWFLEVFDSGSGVYQGRMVVEANQFAIKTAGLPFIPFFVIGLDTYIASLIMGGTLRSANFITGKSGYAINADGSAEFQNILVGGGTVKNKPFELAFGAVQDDVFSDDASGQFKVSVINFASSTCTLEGTAERTPNSIKYSLSAKYASNAPVLKNVNVPRAKGAIWSPISIICQNNIGGGGTSTITGFSFDEKGDIYFDEHYVLPNGNLIGNTRQLLASSLNEIDQDPLFVNAVYNQTKVWAIKPRVKNGITHIQIPATVLVSGVPTPVTKMKIKAWGAGGAGTYVGTGGPGGYAENTISVSPGDVYSFLAGAGEAIGFGGIGFHDARFANPINSFFGGGGTFVFKGPPRRANIILAAGGGGSSGFNVNGGPGGSATFSGGNGSTSTEIDRCVGKSFPSLSAALLSRPAGGGGYEGGNNTAGWGFGGTNYIAAPLLSSQNLASAMNGTGSSTTAQPPNTSDADYIANSADGFGRLAVGVGADRNATPGSALITVQFFTT
jgi:Putative phage tail protein